MGKINTTIQTQPHEPGVEVTQRAIKRVIPNAPTSRATFADDGTLVEIRLYPCAELSEDEIASIREVVASMRPKPPAEHLPGCTEQTEETVEDAEPRVGDLGLLEQNTWTTLKGGCVDECPLMLQLQREQSRPITGTWTCSTNDEHWDCSEHFDTEADAIEYGKVYCAEMGEEDGSSYYTGQIHAMDADELAGHGIDADRVIEQMEEHLYENVGSEVDIEIRPTQEQKDDLDARMARTIKQWLVHHDLTPHVYTIERMTSHIYEQCTEVDSMKYDPAHHPRCVRPKGHPMDAEGHDFQDVPQGPR